MDEQEIILTDEMIQAYSSALTLPEDMAEAADFEASEAIEVDMKTSLPDSYSLGEWIYETSNQGRLGSCTSLGTTHATQILNVKKWWVKPTTNNIVTPDWKDLRSKMWHSTTKYDGWDYVENAVSKALKEWIKTIEKWEEVKFDWYAYWDWNSAEYDKNIDMMKRYLYAGCPIVWCVRWNKTMWTEMSKWEVKTVPTSTTWWHCIALVGWDKGWFWFINSRTPNDANKRKSRFYVSFDNMKKIGAKFNWRYRVLYIKAKAKIDPARLKKINVYAVVLEVLKKYYNSESPEVQAWIVALSQPLRKAYPELNEKIPL